VGDAANNRALTINGSSVGINLGATAPAYTLDVSGQIRSSSGGIVFPDGTTQTTAYSQLGVFQVGNGNINVPQALWVDSNLNGGAVYAPHAGVWIEWNTTSGMTDFVNNQGQGAGGWQFINTNDGGTPTGTPMVILASGDVGIGTTGPQYPLDVAGTIRTTSGGVIFPDGTTQTTAFIPANCGADYAESVGVTGDRTKYEPGDILVIDPDAPGKFLKSNQAYSSLVAGIYSTKPGFVGRLQPETAETKATEVPLAMIGRVPTKVNAENGPIKVGDLLVTSSTMGYAMKGTDRDRMLGAVIGKALAPLDSGAGVVMVLVTLQ
jgi:hypothetical protein